MTGRAFWVFMRKFLEKGRIPMISGCIDSEELEGPGQYIGGHALLPPGYESIPAATIIGFSELLRDSTVAIKTKEAILMILAHHVSREALNILKAYNKCPDAELAIFAELALQECEMWNE